MIIQQNIQYLQLHYPEMLSLEISDLRIGAYMMVVRLSDGSIGLASFEKDEHIHCAKENRDYGDFTPLKITGRTLAGLFEIPKSSALINALRVAVLNAVSNTINKKNNIKIVRNVDLIDLLNPGRHKKVVMVGAFHTYIRKIIAQGRPLQVLELDREAMLPEHQDYYRHADQFPIVLQDAGIVIITGLTMVNNTFDDLLKACPADAQIAVVGPSSNLLAEVLFARNVSIIGSTLITHPDLVFDLISQGAAGYHLFEYCAEKVFILNEKQS